jgi:hypothetical protein
MFNSKYVVLNWRPTVWASRVAQLFNLSLGVTYLALWVMLAWQGGFWRADFSAFYTGWSIARDGLGASLYDFDLQTRYQQRILEGRAFSDGLLPYLNPPHATVPFVPLSSLPLGAAFWVWSLIQAALLVWLVRLLLQLAAGWEPRERRLMLSAVAAFPPLFFSLQLGAFSLFMLLCLLHYYLALKRDRDGAAAWWLLLGTIKPQLMLLPGLALLGARRWRALGVTALGGVVLVAVSSVALGWQSWAGFLGALRTVNAYYDAFGIVPTTMYNLKGTLALVLGNERGELITWISVAALALAAGLTLWLWRGPRRTGDASFELRMGLTILLGLLVSPHLHRQDGVMFIAPAVLFYSYLRQRGLPRRAFAVWALASPLIVLVSEFTVGGGLGIRAPVVLMLALAGWMCMALAAEARREGVRA